MTAKKSLIPDKPKSFPIPPFEELTVLIYGAPGTGKTTFCAGAESTLFLSTEPGTEFLEAASVPVYNWMRFKEVLDELEMKKKAITDGKIPKENWHFKSFVIDIVDNLSAQCRDWVCKQKGLAYPPTNDFGKTWAEITTEWRETIRRLMILGNVRFITHCTTQETETATEDNLVVEVTRHVPTFFGSKPAQFLDGIINAQGFCAVNKKGQHCITFKQTATIAAKDRTGLLASFGTLPLDWNTVKDAYAAKAAEVGKTIISRRSL